MTQVRRHLIFWLTYCLLVFLSSLYPWGPHAFLFFLVYKIALIDLICFLPLSVITVYTLLLFYFPVFIRKSRYWLFLLGLFPLAVVNVCLGYYLSHIYFLLTNPGPYGSWMELACWQTAYLRGANLAMSTGIIACGLKIVMEWRKTQQARTELVLKKAADDLRLAGVQVMPQFLLYTLELLSDAITQSCEEASKLILRLSDVFSYVLYGSRESYVSLQQELDIIDQLVEVRLEGQIEGKFIVPLSVFFFITPFLDEHPEIWIEAGEGTLSVRLCLSGHADKTCLIPMYKPLTYAPA
jgi:hypothetical protein